MEMTVGTRARATSPTSNSFVRELPTRRSLVSLMSLPRLRSSSPEMRRRTKSLYAQGSTDRKFAAKVSREIDAQLEKDKKDMEKVVKLLLLGPSESGKTTVVKQMQIIHLNGFTKEQLTAMRSYIYANVVVAMGQILKGMKKIGIDLPSSLQAGCFPTWIPQMLTLKEDANHVFFVSKETRALKCLSERLVLAVSRLWHSDPVQEAYERCNEFQLIDCAKYFLDAIGRLAADNYCPTQKDVLHARTKTTGVNELRYPYNDKELLIVDVGGQRSERRKWISLFDNVNAVFFISAISEYDQVMYEDETKNRLHDALELFNEIGNHRFFKHVHIILFLNKKDLFEWKIQRVHLKVCFPKYKYKNDFKNASKYIIKKFEKQIEDKDKIIYPHLTCATDTDQIKFVTNSVADMVIAETLRTTGMA